MILVIGNFGFRKNQLDGQTVKTRNVYRLFSENFDNVIHFDVQDLEFNRYSIFKLFSLILKSKKIIYLPGINNLKTLAPFLSFYVFLKGVKIDYFVVGGWLSKFLEENPRYINILSKFNVIYVETDFLVKKLKGIGLNNVSWIPNFRFHNFLSNKSSYESSKLKVVFMARVMKEKGVDVIFEGLKTFSQFANESLEIHFFGQIHEDYCDRFYSELNNCSVVSYEGVLDPNEIYSVLSRYDVLILPTFYEGEGFPGTILDAYISGIPVISTKWKQIPEFIEDGKTGFLVEVKNTFQLFEKLIFLHQNRKVLNDMKLYAKEKSEKYSVEKALLIIKNK